MLRLHFFVKFPDPTRLQADSGMINFTARFANIDRGFGLTRLCSTTKVNNDLLELIIGKVVWESLLVFLKVWLVLLVCS